MEIQVLIQTSYVLPSSEKDGFEYDGIGKKTEMHDSFSTAETQ